MSKIENVARKLAEGWRARAPYESLSGDMAPADLNEAYTIQRALNEQLIPDRGAIAGRKIALSSQAMQEMVGLSTPIAGAIHAREVWRSPAEIDLGQFRHMGIEYELAFELGRTVSPTEGRIAPDNALDYVASVRPAFELIEDRGADYAHLDGLTLAADNAWCGGIVLGEPIANWRDLDLGNLSAILEQDGQEPEQANTGAANPVTSLAWVFNHVTSSGGTISAGEHVITGSVLRTRFPKPGDHLKYTVDDRASVELRVR